MLASTALADPATVAALGDPPPVVATPARVTITVTIAGLYDVLTNTIRAVGGTRFTDLPSLARLRLHLADGRLHATATDRFRVHRDWTPLLDNTPACLPDPLFLSAADVATLRALLRRRLAAALRCGPATLTVGAPTPDGALRPVRLAVGNVARRDSLTVASHTDPDLPYPDIAATDRTFRGWSPTDTVRLNPRFLTDAAQITHDGRPAPRHAGIQLHFRADRTSDLPGPVRITHPARPSWTADIMPIRAGLDDQ